MNPLETLAASLSPGQWGALTTDNIGPTLASNGTSLCVLEYADVIRWDRVTKRLLFMGGDHDNNGSVHPEWIHFEASTNRWDRWPLPSWFGIPDTMHGYHCFDLDPVGRKFYFKQVNHRFIRRCSLDDPTGPWDLFYSDPNADVMHSYLQAVCGAAWFPEINALTICSSPVIDDTGYLVRFQEPKPVSIYGQALDYYVLPPLPMGELDNIAEYNPIHKGVLFGGGDPAPSVNHGQLLYWVDGRGSGSVQAVDPAPFVVGVTFSVTTCDPATGDYLVIFTNGQLWQLHFAFDANKNFTNSGSQWTRLPDPPGAAGLGILSSSANKIEHTVAGPVDSYGVTVWVVAESAYPQNGQGQFARMWVYKHGTSAAPPAPPFVELLIDGVTVFVQQDE